LVIQKCRREALKTLELSSASEVILKTLYLIFIERKKFKGNSRAPILAMQKKKLALGNEG
jgi:hypothetical protein